MVFSTSPFFVVVTRLFYVHTGSTSPVALALALRSSAGSARGRGVVAAVEQLVTDEGEPGEGRG